MTDRLPSLEALAGRLAGGSTSAATLLGVALDHIDDPAGQGKPTFTRVHRAAATAAASASDALRAAGTVASPLAGLPISVKDLFDVAGEPTPAGSLALADAPPAQRDAPIVARLRAAGAVIVGRTNMTEFAFSGVGWNPHYGTPLNPYDRATGRIPGGSSSGAAVSVTDLMAAAAIGTDTGGSVRIPAALCGVVGFKPTAKRVSRDGAIPLSTTLDSIGPLANSVACCAITDAVMAGEEPIAPEPATVAGLRLAVPQTFMLDDLASEVANAFEAACSALSRAGAQITDLPLTELGEYLALSDRGLLVNSEAFAWHEDLLARRGNEYDPRVRSRIEFGRPISAAAYIRLCAARADWIRRVAANTAGFDALVMPTVAITAPPISAFTDDREFWRLNGLILRNTAVINFLDRCAITLPIQALGSAPVGLMIVGEHGADRRLLAVSRGIEAALAAAR